MVDGVGRGRMREGAVVEERSCENGEMEEGGVAERGDGAMMMERDGWMGES